MSQTTIILSQWQRFFAPSCKVVTRTYITGDGKKAPARFCECFRQVQAAVVSKSSNKIHQTWPKPFSRALYKQLKCFPAWPSHL